MTITALKALFAALFVYMVYTLTATSLESNLFEEWPRLAEIPWMAATLKDFYVNMVIVMLWAAYKERRWPTRLLWLTLFVALGAVATTFYTLLELFRLQPDEGVAELLAKRRPAREVT